MQTIIRILEIKMQRIVRLNSPVVFASYAAVGGREESLGRYGDKFDLCDKTDLFGMKTFELAEGEMCRCALNIALGRAGVAHSDIDLLFAGDLQNQCSASSIGLHSFGIPFLGIYGACSTCTEGLLLASAMMEADAECERAAVVTSSHNSAAERQFRNPLEYGGQRAGTAQWTSTAAGAFILGRDGGRVKITEYMPGKVIDGACSDGANMGPAMAFAAADSIISYFDLSGEKPENFDYVVTGDLGKYGSRVLEDILYEKYPTAARRHTDCGLLLYDFATQDVHAGASGCGTSASLLALEFLPALERGDIRNILFLSTGALMNPSVLLQGSDIYGVAPLIRIENSGEKG